MIDWKFSCLMRSTQRIRFHGYQILMSSVIDQHSYDILQPSLLYLVSNFDKRLQHSRLAYALLIYNS